MNKAAASLFLFIFLVIGLLHSYVDPQVQASISSSGSAPVVILLNDSSSLSITPSMSSAQKESVLSQRRALYSTSQNRLISSRGIRMVKAQYNTFNGFAATLDSSQLSQLSSDPSVVGIYYDRTFHGADSAAWPLINVSPVYSIQVNGMNSTGSGKTICLLDTGVNYTHPDFGGCPNATAFAAGTCPKFVGGYDFVNSDSDPMDDNNHGTHIAGIINRTAPGARIAVVKVLDSTNSGTLSNILSGIDWCNSNQAAYNISVISMSITDNTQYNSSTCPSWFSSSLATSKSNGIFVAAASGNNHFSGGVTSPACDPSAYSVGAVYASNVGSESWNTDPGTCSDPTTAADQVACFTNYGPNLDMLAPGAIITSTNRNGGTLDMGGTSQAVPFVSASVALVQSALSVQGKSLTPDQIYQKINQTGKRIAVGPYSVPRIDAYSLFAASVPLMNSSSASVGPSSAYTTATLIGYCSAGTTDSSNVSYNYTWFRNGVAASSGVLFSASGWPIGGSGGTVTSYTNATGTYAIHTFTSSGTFTAMHSGTSDVLVVGGGGGSGGGINGVVYEAPGGGGQVLQRAISIGAGSYLVVVGNGGSFSIAGGNSSFFNITAVGGSAGIYGGTGGTSGSGHSGGAPYSYSSGGGAGDSQNGFAATSSTTGGNGGAGTYSSITGANVAYGGGGAGQGPTYSGTGGAGYNSYGGGGSSYSPNAWNLTGISGVVIIRYLNNSPPLGSFSSGSQVNVANVTPANLSAGDNWTLQCTAYTGNLTSVFYSSQITIISPEPIASSFNGASSTDFSNVSDLQNVTNFTLDMPGRGRIRFPPSHGINAVGQDYDTNVVIGNGFVSVNSSGLDSSFNSSATLTINASGIYSGTFAPAIYYYEPFVSSLSDIKLHGSACSSPRCTGITWNSSTQVLTFNVSGFSGYGIYSNGTLIAYGSNATIGINITSTNQIAVYTSSSKNNSALSFVSTAPPAAGSIILESSESSNVTGGDTGFLVENQGNVNVSITVASDKNAASFIGGSSPLFQMFGAENKTGSCPGINATAQDLGTSPITLCPSLAFSDSQDTIWAYVLVKINSDSPPQSSTATLTFTSTQV